MVDEQAGKPLDDKTAEWVEHYMGVWRLGYSLLPEVMKSEEAKAGAINGMMIGADRHGLLKLLTQTPVPAPAVKASDEARAPPAQIPPEKPKPVETKESEPSPPRQSTLGMNVPEAQDVSGLPAYDRNKPGWNYCPSCGNRDITHTKTPPKQGKYQACWECRLWLPPDKNIPTPMDDGGEKR